MKLKSILLFALIILSCCIVACNSEPEKIDKITWIGDFADAPINPAKYDCYYNTIDGCSYIYDGTSWTLLAKQGSSGEKGDKGDSGFDGQSIEWKGSYVTAPKTPANLWAYYNTSDGCSYIYQNGNWTLLAGRGASITWLGSFVTAPSSSILYAAYYNTTDGCSYIYDGTKWTLLAQKGNKGDTGEQGIQGLQGTSIVWKGSQRNAPINAEELWAYYNTQTGSSYIFSNGTWKLLAGRGASISWLGSLSKAPEDPVLYEAYYNTIDGCSYIYDGTKWSLLAQKGSKGDTGEQGEQGIQGVQGLQGASIVWKGSLTEYPETPENLWAFFNLSDGCSYIYQDGTWSLIAVSGAIINWLGSFAEAPTDVYFYDAYFNITDGCTYIYDGDEWILIARSGAQGEKGDKGDTGAQGAAGLDGKSIIWKGTSYTAPANPVELWAYYNATDGNAYIYSNGAWNLLMENLSVNYNSPTIIGTVVASTSYEAKNVYVKVVDETTQNTVWNSQVAADGDFAISGLDETKTYSLYFTTTKLPDVNLNAKGLTLQEPTTYGLLRQNVKPSSGTAHNVGNITLAPNGKVYGKIVNSTSEPISEADVFLEGTSYMTSTDSSGNYILDDVIQGQYTLIIRKDGFAEQKKDITLFTSDGSKSPVLDNGTLTLSDVTFSVNGKVAYNDKTSKAGVTVSLLSSEGKIVQTVTSKEDGTFSFSEIEPGTYTVKAQADDYSSVEKEIVGTYGKTYDIDLGSLVSNYGSIDGTILDSCDCELSGASIKLLSNSSVEYSFSSDSDGKFTSSKVRVGEYNVSIEYGEISKVLSTTYSVVSAQKLSINLVIEHQHTWNEGEITTAATCTTNGVKTFTCTVCGQTKTEVIATAHSYDTEWSKDETTHWHSAGCEHTSEKSDVAEHTWNDGEVTTEATCSTEGLKTYTCTICGQTKLETVMAPPTNVIATKGQESITLSWDSVDYATGYEIQKYVVSLKNGKVVNQVFYATDTTTSTTYEERTSDLLDQIVLYKLRSVKADGTTSPWQENYSNVSNSLGFEEAANIGYTLADVSNLEVQTANLNAEGKVEGYYEDYVVVSWNMVPGATSYELTSYTGSKEWLATTTIQVNEIGSYSETDVTDNGKTDLGYLSYDPSNMLYTYYDGNGLFKDSYEIASYEIKAFNGTVVSNTTSRNTKAYRQPNGSYWINPVLNILKPAFKEANSSFSGDWWIDNASLLNDKNKSYLHTNTGLTFNLCTKKGWKGSYQNENNYLAITSYKDANTGLTLETTENIQFDATDGGGWTNEGHIGTDPLKTIGYGGNGTISVTTEDANLRPFTIKFTDINVNSASGGSYNVTINGREYVVSDSSDFIRLLEKPSAIDSFSASDNTVFSHSTAVSGYYPVCLTLTKDSSVVSYRVRIWKTEVTDVNATGYEEITVTPSSLDESSSILKDICTTSIGTKYYFAINGKNDLGIESGWSDIDSGYSAITGATLIKYMQIYCFKPWEYIDTNYLTADYPYADKDINTKWKDSQIYDKISQAGLGSLTGGITESSYFHDGTIFYKAEREGVGSAVTFSYSNFGEVEWMNTTGSYTMNVSMSGDGTVSNKGGLTIEGMYPATIGMSNLTVKSQSFSGTYTVTQENGLASESVSP